jgi:ribose transport system permease protein
MKDRYYQTGEVFQRYPTPKETGHRIGSFFKVSWRKANFIYINLFIFLIYLFSSLSSFNWNLMTNILYSSVTVGIVALGMGLIILTGQIDLSVGSIFAFVAGIAVLTYNDVFEKTGNAAEGLVVTLIVSLALGAFFGFVNGFLIGKVKMPSFIVTLATMLILRSLIQFILSSLPGKPSLFRVDKYGTEGDPFFTLGNYQVAGISLVGILFLILGILIWFMATYTKYGRKIYAVGSNSKAASLVGINTGWLQASIFTLAGALVGFGAFLQLGIRGNVDPATTGKSYELYSIAAVVLGGVSMTGGSGNLIGILFGTLAFQTIDKIIAALKLNAYLNDTIKGIILIIAVLIQVLKVSPEDVKKLFERLGWRYQPDKDLILDAKMKNQIAKIHKSYQKKIDKINASQDSEEAIIAAINKALDEEDQKVADVTKNYQAQIVKAKRLAELHDNQEEKGKAIAKLSQEKANEEAFRDFRLQGGKGELSSLEEEETIRTDCENVCYQKKQEILALESDQSVARAQQEALLKDPASQDEAQKELARLDEEAKANQAKKEALEKSHQEQLASIKEAIAKKKASGAKPGQKPLIPLKNKPDKAVKETAKKAEKDDTAETAQQEKQRKRLEAILAKRQPKNDDSH